MTQVVDEPSGSAVVVAALPHLHVFHKGLVAEPAVWMGGC